jgi:dienelactone hydrolase
MNHLWDIDLLQVPPKTYNAPDFDKTGIKALFYETLDWQGRPTRTFAYIGLPAEAKQTKVPAMVLVHGGGGTAFADWVQHWTARGYAAIAMDVCGCTDGGDNGNRPRHEFGGPHGWGGWDQIGWDVKDQWVYHAVADIILGHSLLRSLPEVDAARIGLTGISWGGFLTCIVAGLDSRFAFAAPVYGCGFISENEFFSTFLPEDERLSQRWLKHWDPSNYLPAARMPMLWVNGTNDFAFPMNVHQKSYRLPSGSRYLSIGLRMEHSQPAGSRVAEIEFLADSLFKGQPSLCKFIEQGRDGAEAWALFETDIPISNAVLCFTRDTNLWIPRLWKETVATLDGTTARTILPADAAAYFFNVRDERGFSISSEMEQIF